MVASITNPKQLFSWKIMVNQEIKPTYFGTLLEKFREGDSEALLAFGRHLHWGYWKEPAKADGSVADFARASEMLSQIICNVGGVRDGARILDAGCGFGGTVASINERFANVQVVGVNIDREQLARAKNVVRARPSNEVEFVEADACNLPFEDASFDCILAIECIFAFSSRERFFQEARRVLKPGGRLTLCDFLLSKAAVPFWRWLERRVSSQINHTFNPENSLNYGSSLPPYFCTIAEYHRLSKMAGLEKCWVQDITRNTLPTYPVVYHLMGAEGDKEIEKTIHGLELFNRLRILHYMILSFQIPQANK